MTADHEATQQKQIIRTMNLSSPNLKAHFGRSNRERAKNTLKVKKVVRSQTSLRGKSST